VGGSSTIHPASNLLRCGSSIRSRCMGSFVMPAENLRKMTLATFHRRKFRSVTGVCREGVLPVNSQAATSKSSLVNRF
jgi:hypothetical protein